MKQCKHLNCDKCHCREARCETWCTLYRTYEDAASAMLAARDKEWVEKEKNLVSFISLIIKREGCIDALECEHNEGCVENVLHGKCNKAQELKKEVSNGK